MDIYDTFKHDVMSLGSICLNAVAARLWDSLLLRREIANKWTNDNVKPNFLPHYYYPNYFEVHDTVRRKVLQLPLPEKLILQLKDLVLIMGYQLTEYMFYVIWVLKLDLSYIDQVYWTCYGTLDIDKIYYLYWKKKPDFMDPGACVERNGVPLVYLMAGILGDEEYMKEIQDIIREIVKNKHPDAEIEETDDIEYTAILSLYLFQPNCYPPQGPHYCTIQFFEFCQKISCLFRYKTAQYIWRKMDDYEKELVIERLLNEEMLYNFIHGETFYHVISDMEKKKRNNFLMKKSLFIMDNMKLHWPFSKLLLFRYDAEMNPKNYFIHIIRCLTIIEDDFNDGLYKKPAAYLLNAELFLKIWNKLPKDDKLKFFNLDYRSLRKKVDISDDLNWCVFMRYSIYYPCLERIVNDPDVQSLRQKIEDTIVDILLLWVIDDDGPEVINDLLHEVFTVDKERKRMENQLNLAVKKKYKLKFSVDYKLFKTYRI